MKQANSLQAFELQWSKEKKNAKSNKMPIILYILMLDIYILNACVGLWGVQSNVVEN